MKANQAKEKQMDLRINFERLKEDIEALGKFGRDQNGGITRPSFSRADLEARMWLKERIESAGLVFRQDGVGNIFGLIEGKGKTVMAGSHIDTVINGGMFDGSVGVLSALECLRRLKEEAVELSKPVGLVSFTDEEGNLVGDFLGSRAFVNELNKEELEKGITQFGAPLKEILKGTEFTIETILAAHMQAPQIDTYLELHIEQGETLETEDVAIGIVEHIAGKRYRLCSYLGKAEHGGTTPLELRHDAFLGLSDFALKATQLVATKYYGNMITLGKVRVSPGAFSIVPGLVEFSLDLRSGSKETLEEIENVLLFLAQDIASTRGLFFSSKLVDSTNPVSPSERTIRILKEECEKLGYTYLLLPSGAGHDAQILASVTDVGMIFIPSIEGISHSPEESIKWEDLEKGANLLLHSLIRLASS